MNGHHSAGQAQGFGFWNPKGGPPCLEVGPHRGHFMPRDKTGDIRGPWVLYVVGGGPCLLVKNGVAVIRYMSRDRAHVMDF